MMTTRITVTKMHPLILESATVSQRHEWPVPSIRATRYVAALAVLILTVTLSAGCIGEPPSAETSPSASAREVAIVVEADSVIRYAYGVRPSGIGPNGYDVDPAELRVPTGVVRFAKVVATWEAPTPGAEELGLEFYREPSQPAPVRVQGRSPLEVVLDPSSIKPGMHYANAIPGNTTLVADLPVHFELTLVLAAGT